VGGCPIFGEADWEALQEESEARQDEVSKLALKTSIADLKNNAYKKLMIIGAKFESRAF
jgi:hypothetical protein